jgi:hypothetical protein
MVWQRESSFLLRHTECACYIKILAYFMQAGHLPKGEVARKRLSTEFFS